MKQIPQQPLEECKPAIDYPCVWQYKIIGMDRKAVQAVLFEQLGDAPYSLSDSRQSSNGKYISMNLEVTVHSDAQRVQLYTTLADHAAVKMVL
jgi:putative lipoic acid-binding regulatory protein